MSHLHRSTVYVSCSLCAVFLTAACATHSSTLTAELADEPLICHRPMFEHESLGELIDKHAPSAIEWSLLPKLTSR